MNRLFEKLHIHLFPASAHSTYLRYSAVLVALGILTHFVGFNYPRQVVFDEVHFGKFVSAYCCNKDRIFDVHPPHAKLLIAGAVALSSYDGSFDFVSISQDYPHNVSPFAFRVIPALSGILIPVLVLLLLAQCGLAPHTALLASTALVLDNALILQTRIIALDGILILAVLSAMLFSLRSVRTNTRASLIWSGLSGAAAAMAVGCKFTGLIAPAVALIALMASLAFRSPRAWRVGFERALVFAGLFVVVYLGGWWLHFSLLTNAGYADKFFTTTHSFWTDLISSHHSMLQSNMQLSAHHPDASSWWTWPFMFKPVYYWAGRERHLYFVGNPIVWWGATALFIIATIKFVSGEIHSFYQRQWPEKLSWLQWWLLLGYLGSLIPLTSVSRVLFLYHYLISLLFSVAFVAIGIERYGWLTQKRSLSTVYAALTLGFVLISPVTYGFQTPWLTWLLGCIRMGMATP